MTETLPVRKAIAINDERGKIRDIFSLVALVRTQAKKLFQGSKFRILRLNTAGYKQYVDTGVEGIHLVQHPAASKQALEEWAKAYGYETTRPT